jgi:predicted negative regulator of RcsB-dependent stress response
VASLASAVERAPVPLNLLFLGDAYWIVDRKDEAIEAWEQATRAETGDSPQDSAPLVRESARLRVLSARAAQR